MTYFNRTRGLTMKRALVNTSKSEPAKERIYKDDDLVMDSFGTLRRTAAEKRALDDIADRHLRFRI